MLISQPSNCIHIFVLLFARPFACDSLSLPSELREKEKRTKHGQESDADVASPDVRVAARLRAVLAAAAPAAVTASRRGIDAAVVVVPGLQLVREPSRY